MTTALAAPQATTLLPELTREAALTRRVLERAPEAHFGWQPHPKSMTLGRLTAHISSLLNGISTALQTDEIDLLTRHASFVPSTSTAALLQEFDANTGAALTALAETNDDTFQGSWTLRRGDYIISRQSRADMVRHLISHISHHRGQLSVYLRLLEVPVPSIYGPTADEPQG
jgi:uncharacterized damage-inducible protein DinB